MHVLVHGGFSEWGEWSPCTLSCGSGTKETARTCTNPEPEHGGDNCTGEFSQTVDCNTQSCPGRSVYELLSCHS